eukprot:9504173-Pyramimonas_sp.AAC.1
MEAVERMKVEAEEVDRRRSPGAASSGLISAPFWDSLTGRAQRGRKKHKKSCKKEKRANKELRAKAGGTEDSARKGTHGVEALVDSIPPSLAGPSTHKKVVAAKTKAKKATAKVPGHSALAAAKKAQDDKTKQAAVTKKPAGTLKRPAAAPKAEEAAEPEAEEAAEAAGGPEPEAEEREEGEEQGEEETPLEVDAEVDPDADEHQAEDDTPLADALVLTPPDDGVYGADLHKETVVDNEVEYEVVVKYRKSEGFMTLGYRVKGIVGKNEYKQLIQVDDKTWSEELMKEHACDTREAMSRKVIGRIFYHIIEHGTVDKEQAKIIRFNVIKQL